MTLVERRIFRINDFVDNINPAQICVEPMEDPDLDFRMYCGTDILGNATKWLAKDQKARITDLSITDRLNMNTNDVVNVGSLYAPWTDLENDIWARLRFYYNGAYPTSEFVQARPGLECGVRLDATQSKVDFFCDTNRGLFFNGPEMTLKDYDSDTSKYNFLLTSDSGGAVLESGVDLGIGSAGSLSLFDVNILSCEDWDTDTVLLSATEQEVQECFKLFGEVKSIFGMISALSGVTDLQRAYDNGTSVILDSGYSKWEIPSDAASPGPVFEIANSLVTNAAECLTITNESTAEGKKAIFFNGDAGDSSSSGALGHKLWTDDSISIGRTNSDSYNSYCVANAANISDTVVATRSMIYADGTDDFSNDVEAYVSVIAGKQGGSGSMARFSTIYGYSETGQAIWESGLGGKLTLGNSASLGSTESTLSFYDGYRAASDYTGTSVPLAKSSAEWSAFAALAGATGSIINGILAAATAGLTPHSLILKIKSGITEGTDLYTFNGSAAKTLDFKQGSNITLTEAAGSVTIAATNTTYPLTQGHIAYGNGTGITGEADLFYDAISKRIGLRTVNPAFGLDINGVSGFSGSLGMSGWASGGYPTMYIRSSRSGTVGSYSATLANQNIARILVQGSSGTEHIDAIQMSVVSDVASGDWDTSDNRSAHLRISLMSSGTLTERLRIRSTGVLYGANIILADANKAGYTNEGIPLSSSGQWASIVSLAGDNCTLFGAILAASSGPAYTASLGIIKSGLDFRHSNSVTAQATQALYPIKIDAQGHISAYGTAVTALPNANALTLKIKSGSTEGTSQYTYTGAAVKALNFLQGTNVTLTAGSGTLTIASTNTTYSAGTGLSLAGTTFNHSNSVTAQSTQALYPLTYDAQGHITGSGTAVTSLPTPSSLVLRADGLTSEGTGQYTFDGSVAKTLNVVGGTNVSIAKASGQWTISSTDTTYPITNREIAYGTGTGITSNSSLSWDTSNYYIRLFRASNTAQADIRFYLENATGDRRIGSDRSMGRIRFYGAHDSSTHAVGISIDAITDGDWAVSETRSTKLGLYMRHQNVDSYVYTFKSNGSIAVGSNAVSDWSHSQVLASQRLDGSTAGSSQSIVAMTLGLRTTSTTENQVLKLTSSDSASPLVIADGYKYSFLVQVSWAPEGGQGNCCLYLVQAVGKGTYSENGSVDSRFIATAGSGGPDTDPGYVNFYMDNGVLQIRVSPPSSTAYNWMATIGMGTKLKGAVPEPLS